MTLPVLATDRPLDPPTDGPTVAASLQALRDRVESMAEVKRGRTIPFGQYFLRNRA